MKWKHSHCTPNRAEQNRTEPDRACSLADICFYSPADDRFCCAVGQAVKCVLLTMSAITLDCEVLTNAVHLRPALWEQSDKNFQNRDLNLLKPNDIYMCRTAALISRRYILNIYSTNIHTEYFKHAAKSRFFLFKMPFIS